MKLSYLINIGLLLILVALVWFIQQPEKPEVRSSSISDLSPTSVTQISIKRQYGDIELAKDEHGWQIQSPFSAHANNTRIALLLNVLKTPSQQQLNITAETDLSNFGLNKPEAILSLNDQVFEFGNKAPLQQKTYVKHKQAIYLVDDSISQLLNSSANAYINNRLLANDQTLRKLKLPQTTLNLSDGRWHSSNLALSQDEILSIIENWQYAYALQVSPYKNTLDTSHSSIIELWFNKLTEPRQFVVHSNSTLIDMSSRLSYQFSANIQQQLLLTEPKSVAAE